MNNWQQFTNHVSTAQNDFGSQMRGNIGTITIYEYDDDGNEYEIVKDSTGKIIKSRKTGRKRVNGVVQGEI